RKPTWLGDDDDSSDESSPPPARIVIKPVAAFQVHDGSEMVSTDDSDSYISETDEDGRRHISGPNMSPLTPPDNRAMRAAVAKDLIQHSPSQQSLHRRHTIGSCDTKNGQKVSAPSQHASVAEEDEEEETVTSSGFNRDSACRRPSRSKLVSYRQKHSGDRLQSSEDCQPHVSAHSCTKSRHKSHLMHAGHSVLSKSHGNLIDGSVTVHDDMHGMLYSEPSRISRSVSVAAISDPHRSYSPAGHPPRSQSPHMSSGRSESPARRLSLSRSQTFTCSIPRKSRSCLRNETHIATRCDSPQTRSLKRNDSFPPPRSESETNLRAESPRRHSIQVAQTHSVDSTKDTNIPSERSRRYSTQNVVKARQSCASSESESQSAKEISSEEKVESSEENSVPKSRIGIIRARSRPEISNTKSRRLLIKQEEEKFFRKIESVRKGEKTDSALSRTESHRERPASELGMARRSERERPATELDFNRQSRMREHIIRARSGQRAPIISRHSTGELQTMKDGVKAASERQSGVVDRVEGDKDMAKKTVRLSRQSAIRTERSDIRLKIPTKPVSDESDSEAKPKETRLRRVGVVAKTDSMSDENNSNSEPQHSQVKETLPKQTVPKNDVEESQKDNAAKERVRSAARHEFKQVRRVIRSSSEVRLRPEVKPLKGSHNLPVDLENHHLNEIPNQLVIIPPPEFRDPVDAHHSGSNNTINGVETTDGVQHEPCEIPEVIKTSKAEFKVADLLHHKWQNPIECLSLTLEEVTHIRTVLTRAELESLIPDHDLYTQVAKGKLCFTCKKTKFTIFGQWGTKCKFCGRTICNYCLRKMNVPTEHFEKIPVYTLSPVPLSPEVLEALKVYESTGSVPHSPVQTRKTSAVERPPSRGPEDDVTTPGAEGEDRPARRRSLQRSHTIGVGSRPPPNRALLKGPQMSICCDCKSMIMEIIRASRSSVSLLTGKSGSQESSPDTPSRSQTPSSELQGGVSRPRRLELEERPRPRSMLATLNFKSFNLSSKFGSEA
ncbi:SPIR1-like protein, partial [Mya arenaria]